MFLHVVLLRFGARQCAGIIGWKAFGFTDILTGYQLWKRLGVRVVVAAASKHGATAEIADRIAGALNGSGLDAEVIGPGQLDTVDGYDAVVIGSAVYAGRWRREARELAARIGASDPPPPVWLFSSGPLGDPPKPDEEPVDVAGIVESTSARGHRVFAGKLDKAKLSLGERAITKAVRAPEGDYRDWDDIAGWAEEIADTIKAEPQASPGD